MSSSVEGTSRPAATPRRWIVSKDRRICPRACSGWAKPTAVVKITDPATGRVHKKCRECGAEETDHLNSFKDKRPCKRCKNVYDVTVRIWHGGDKDEPEERWKEQCGLCDLETSAALHYQTAKNFFARATKLRAEQKRKEIRAKASASVKALVMTEIEMGAAPALASNETIHELAASEEDVDGNT